MMTGRTTLALILLLLAASAPRAESRCSAPAEIVTAVAPLPSSSRATRSNRPLRILAVGSASMGASSQGVPSFVARLPDTLEAGLGAKPSLVTKVLRGKVAAEQLPVLDEALLEIRPDLVIWQSGTVDAVRSIDPDAFQAAIEAGLNRVEAAGIDLILVDMQFARWSRASIDFAPYQDAIDDISAGRDINVFRRYDLMQGWAEAGRIDIERATPQTIAAELEMLNACLARQLAYLIETGIALKPGNR